MSRTRAGVCHDGPMPLAPPNAVDLRSFAEAMPAADCTVDVIETGLGPEAGSAFGGNTTLSALQALGGADGPEAILLRRFVLQTGGRVAADYALPGRLSRSSSNSTTSPFLTGSFRAPAGDRGGLGGMRGVAGANVVRRTRCLRV